MVEITDNKEGSEGEGLKLPRSSAVASCNEGNVAAIEDMAIADISNFSSMPLEDKLEHLHGDLMALRSGVLSMRRSLISISADVVSIRGDLADVMEDVSSIKLRVESLSAQTLNNRTAIKNVTNHRQEWASGYYCDAVAGILSETPGRRYTVTELIAELGIRRNRLMENLPALKLDSRIIVEQEAIGWQRLYFRSA